VEQNFQTSFIPKKPMIEERAAVTRSVGFFLVISIFVLFTLLLVSGGFYFYKTVLVKNIASMGNDLSLAKNRFEPERLGELQVLDKRLKAGAEVLNNHIAISPIFEALEAITMKTVRFTKFDYSLGDEKNAVAKVKLNGVAVGYRSVALQSDLFAENEYFIDPVFSNLALDNSGNVLFELEFSVDSTFIDYKEILKRAENAPVVPEPSAEN